MMIKIESFGKMIKDLRTMKNMSQAELGNLIGSDRHHISRIENNFFRVSSGTLEKCFKALNANLFYCIDPRFGVVEKKNGQVFIYEPATGNFFRYLKTELKDREPVEFFINMDGRAEIVGKISQENLDNPF